MKAYFIPGLAADKRVFRHIQLPGNFTPVFLEWIAPIKDETLPQYAYRLAEQIEINEPFIIIGLSFGGMLAVEIAKKYPAGPGRIGGRCWCCGAERGSPSARLGHR